LPQIADAGESMARYICFEGTEGVGKTTQTQKLVNYLNNKGYKVLQTKEPGTSHLPLTMILRGIMLDKQYDEQLTRPARELVSQAIRSIHLEKLIIPAMSEYDYIIQDRGILSGLAYGSACGNATTFLTNLVWEVTGRDGPWELYNDVIYLKGDVKKHLEVAKSAKQEFAAGDAIEAKGADFMQQVQYRMDDFSDRFNTHCIDVNDQSIEQVFSAILQALKIEE
jgi:dTMP kinase